MTHKVGLFLTSVGYTLNSNITKASAVYSNYDGALIVVDSTDSHTKDKTFFISEAQLGNALQKLYKDLCEQEGG